MSNPPIQCETNFLEVSQAKSLMPSLCHSGTKNLEHLFLACHFSSLSLNGLKSSWTPSAINLAPEDHLHFSLFAVSASDLIGLTRNRLIQDNSVPSASQLVSLVKKVSLDHLHAWESISPAPHIIPWALLGCYPILISNLVSLDLERQSTEARKSNMRYNIQVRYTHRSDYNMR